VYKTRDDTVQEIIVAWLWGTNGAGFPKGKVAKEHTNPVGPHSVTWGPASLSAGGLAYTNLTMHELSVLSTVRSTVHVYFLVPSYSMDSHAVLYDQPSQHNQQSP
jgi:hypothetical protein